MNKMSADFESMDFENNQNDQKVDEGPHLNPGQKSPQIWKELQESVGLLRKQVIDLSKQNTELLRRQRMAENVFIQIKNNTTQSVEIYGALCTVYTNMSDLKDEIREALLLMKKPGQPYKPKEHLLSRANLTDAAPGTIPTVDDQFLKFIQSAEKYRKPNKFHTPSQDVPVKKEQKAFDQLKKYAFPTPFAHFVRKFLQIPSNCSFFKKGDRTYMCNSSTDRWERCESNFTFWNVIRDYLWQAYVRFICKVRDEHPPNKFLANVVREVQYILPRNIPGNKAGLIYILQSKPSDGDTRLVELLEAAYRSRNKNH